MTIHLWIPGKPTGKARPRFVRATGRTYTDTGTLNAEDAIRSAWATQGKPRIEGPIEIVVGLHVVRPASHYAKLGGLSAEGQRHPFPDRQKPDVDNALKLVMDALNGLAYHDDVRVVSARVSREWADEPATIVIVVPVREAA